MTKKLNKLFIVLAGALILGSLTFAGIKLVQAETSGGSPDSGVASYIKTIYDSLVAKTQGSDAAGGWGDWGAYWNRISSTTALLPNGCSSQQYHDSYGAGADETTNCSLPWTANPTPATGDDARAGRGGLDPRTGLTWSQLLLNNAGTVAFSPTTNSTWTWTAGGANNVAVGNKTAPLLCSDRGNGWRLPTQKELMQAYIDGSYWNLTQPSSNYFWSATEYNSTTAWGVYLDRGNTTNATKTFGFSVRCVRP